MYKRLTQSPALQTRGFPREIKSPQDRAVGKTNHSSPEFSSDAFILVSQIDKHLSQVRVQEAMLVKL